MSASTAVFAVTSGCGHEPGNPPCKDTTLRTSRRRPPVCVRPSTMSKLSSSARPCPHLGEVPPQRRRRAADPAPGIQGSSSLEDAADRPHRRHDNMAARHELAVDGPGAVLAQIARRLQFAAPDQHEVLDRRFGPPDASRDRSTIPPIDAVQGQIAGTSAPPLHGEEPHIMRPGYRSHRGARPHLSDYRAPLLLPPPKGFLPIASCSKVFPKHHSDQEMLAPQRPTGCDTWPLMLRTLSAEVFARL